MIPLGIMSKYVSCFKVISFMGSTEKGRGVRTAGDKGALWVL
jgi:hypothetical protein